MKKSTKINKPTNEIRHSKKPLFVLFSSSNPVDSVVSCYGVHHGFSFFTA